MPLPAAVPIIAAAGSVLGGLFDSGSRARIARSNTDKTIAANKAEAELAYQRQVQMWHMQNLYNTPEQQMKRFTAAGLNPHLIYGQGSPGNASSPPAYSPPDMRYQYEAPPYGAAVQSVLPMLMNIGSWLQDMRLGQAQIKKVNVDTDRSLIETGRVQQLIEYLGQRNPQVLQEGSNRLSLFPYQKDMQSYNTNLARTKLFETEQEFRYKFGDDLFNSMDSAWHHKGGLKDIGGVRRLQFLQELSKQKLLEAKSSWSEFDITDPQQIMMMVLNGVMGLAGQTLRLSTHRKPKTTNEVTESLRNGRTKTRRTIREY